MEAIGVDVQVLDDDGNPVPMDGETIGEVCARSNVVLKGYWLQPEETAKAIYDGYFHSGDLGVWDEFGNIHIVDRKKDVIISGGENISSPEIEDALYKHPAVLECAVIGVPSEKWGETPKALIVLREGTTATEAEIIEFSRAASRALQVPDLGGFRRVPAAHRHRQAAEVRDPRAVLEAASSGASDRRQTNRIRRAYRRRKPPQRMGDIMDGQRSTTDEAMLGLARRFFAAVTAGDVDAVREIYAPDAGDLAQQRRRRTKSRAEPRGAALDREERQRTSGTKTSSARPPRTGFVEQHVTRGRAPNGDEFAMPACIVCTVVSGQRDARRGVSRFGADGAAGGYPMNLAKPHIDVGLFTNNTEAMLAFWQQKVGLPFEETLPLGGGVRQHRHGTNGSVLKLNSVRDPMAPVEPSGYREVWIARDGIDEPVELVDPDGNSIRLVPRGHEGVEGIAVRMAVRDAAKMHHFLGVALQLPPRGPNSYTCGDSLIMFEPDPSASPVGSMQALGYRYLTVQVQQVDIEHAGITERGGAEGRPPLTLGTTARISFVRDPDGNWIEHLTTCVADGSAGLKTGEPAQAVTIPCAIRPYTDSALLCGGRPSSARVPRGRLIEEQGYPPVPMPLVHLTFPHKTPCRWHHILRPRFGPTRRPRLVEVSKTSQLSIHDRSARPLSTAAYATFLQ